MIICVIFLLIMNMMMNSFSFNERMKTILLCKPLSSLDYKEDLFTTLNPSYADYKRFLLSKLLPLLGSQS